VGSKRRHDLGLSWTESNAACKVGGHRAAVDFCSARLGMRKGVPPEPWSLERFQVYSPVRSRHGYLKSPVESCTQPATLLTSSTDLGYWPFGFVSCLAAGAVAFFVCFSLSSVRESAALKGYSRTDSCAAWPALLSVMSTRRLLARMIVLIL
jgi:hypothetical protein